MSSMSNQGRAGTYRRPYDFPLQSRSVASGIHGMCCTSQPLACQTALSILQSGGNAVDAAVACNAVLSVVEPYMCGPGGDLFCIIGKKGQDLVGLNASGRCPYTLNQDVFKKKGLNEIPLRGALSVSVPGCISAWDNLLSRFGTMSLSQVLQPAIQIGQEGYAVTPIIAGRWQTAAAPFVQDQAFKECFMVEKDDQWNIPQVGDIIKNQNLAKTFQEIASSGRDAFYKGRIGQRIVETVQDAGGYLKLSDLESHMDEWVTPIGIDYKGLTLWEIPPNSQGICSLQILQILKGYDLHKLGGPSSAEYWHHVIEATKLSFTDRANYYSDNMEISVQELISEEYAARQRAKIRPKVASTVIQPGQVSTDLEGDTVYLTVVDKDGMAVSLMQSIYYPFGSGIIPTDLGFCLQNRGCLFSLDPTHANALAPHKRPFNTNMPAVVTRTDSPQDPLLSFAVMGGDMQAQAQVQVFLNWAEFGYNIQAAGDLARVRFNGITSPRHGGPESNGTVVVEKGIDKSERDKLKEWGHLIETEATMMGGYQAILIGPVLQGATEPRNDGLALGY